MSALTSKGQATIPIKIREYLGIKAGDQVEFTIVNGNVVLCKSTGASAYDLGKHLFGKHRSPSADSSSRQSRKDTARDRAGRKHG